MYWWFMCYTDCSNVYADKYTDPHNPSRNFNYYSYSNIYPNKNPHTNFYHNSNPYTNSRYSHAHIYPLSHSNRSSRRAII
jgi:hypothetical protein